jgi:hypothetical protein
MKDSAYFVKIRDYTFNCSYGHDHSIQVSYHFKTSEWNINVDEHQKKTYLSSENQANKGYDLGIDNPEDYDKFVRELNQRMECSLFDWKNNPRQGKSFVFTAPWEQRFIRQFEEDENLEEELELRKKQSEHYAFRSRTCRELECKGYQPLTKTTCLECRKEYEERYDKIDERDIEADKCIFCQKVIKFYGWKLEVERDGLFVCSKECKENYWRIKKQILNWVKDEELRKQLRSRRTVRKYLKTKKKK